MKRNFTSVSETGLRLLSKNFDLHNDFCFVGLRLAPIRRIVTLEFNSLCGDCQGLALDFSSVSVIRVSGVANDIPVGEDGCLDSFGYLHPDDLDVMDGFLPESSATESYHMIFIFRGGLAVKIYAEEANVRLFATDG